LAEVTLPLSEGDVITIDACSRRKLVYSNPLLYDLLTTPLNYISSWLVLGPIFDAANQVGGHSAQQEFDHGHPWAAEIISSIDENVRYRTQLDPELVGKEGKEQWREGQFRIYRSWYV
jgi:hypothetical protein